MVELIDGVGMITDITEHIEEMMEERFNKKKNIFKRGWEERFNKKKNIFKRGWGMIKRVAYNKNNKGTNT